MKRRGGDQGGRGKKWRVSQPQNEKIQGQGVLLSTIRRKEKKAGLELINFFEDLVEQLYPELDLSIPEPIKETTKTAKDGDDENDNLDALINGDFVVDVSSNENKQIEPQAESIPKEDDIEAQIQAELRDLQAHKQKQSQDVGKEGEAINGSSSSSSKARHGQKRFRLIDPEVECLMFVSVPLPMDPVKLSCAMLDQIAKTGHVRGKFIQRLSPIYDTTRAEIDSVGTLAESIMSQYYPQSDEPSTFKIDPRLRLHTGLSKMDVIQAIVPTIPSPHKADLHHPKYIINVEVFKMIVGIGILPKYEDYKRFNPQMTAQQYNENNNKGDEDDLAPRSLQKAEETVRLS